MKPMADSWDHAVGDETELAMDARTADPERSMKRLRGPALFFNAKVGWSRLGALLSLAIIAIALVVLYRILRDIDPDELIDAIEATDWRTLLIAALFVAGGYLTLPLFTLFPPPTVGPPDRSAS